jgi:hypothetical protein
MRVLIIGGDHSNKSAKSPLMPFARALGRSLMELASPPAVLLTGGQPLCGGYFDEAVVQGALEVVGTDAASRIVTFPDPESKAVVPPTFAATRTIGARSGARRSRRFEMVLAADAVVSIAGKDGVREMIMLARALGRPALPLPFTGQGSERLWRAIVKADGKRLSELDARWASASIADLRRLPRSVARSVQDMASLACFVARPASQALDIEYGPALERALEGALEDASFHRVEAATTPGAGRIPELMLRQIREAFALVAVVSDERYTRTNAPDARGVNPNVVYELGYADGNGKRCILLAASADDLPFDLHDMRTVVYGGRDTREIREELAAHLRALRDA